MAENTAEKKVVVTLGRIVAFKSEASESDKSVVIKRLLLLFNYNVSSSWPSSH
jgi:hypothetical protein